MKNTSGAAAPSLLSRALEVESRVNQAILGASLVPRDARKAMQDQAALIRTLADAVDSLRHTVAALQER